MKTLWHGCHAATMQGGRYSIIDDAATLTEHGRIAWIGSRVNAPDVDARRVDLRGAWVTPGFIDCHTHLVCGNRGAWWRHREHGARDADEDALFERAKARVVGLMRDGVTALEVKSGYGFDTASERKMLRVARRLGDALPPEFAGRADDYIAHVCDEMLPALVAEGLVDAVDAFCEHLAFSHSRWSACSVRRRRSAFPSSCMLNSCRRCTDRRLRRDIARCRRIISST